MLTFSSQTLSLGNWITRKQEEAAPLAPTPLNAPFKRKGIPSESRSRFGKAYRPEATKFVPPPCLPPPPPPHTHTVRMAENKERGRGDNNIPFILFEGISKSILFNSILLCCYIISFQCEKCNYLALIRGGGSDQFTASEKLPPPPPPNILNLGPPSSHPQYSIPSYAYVLCKHLMKERLIFHLDFNLIENLLDCFNSLQACTQCVFVWWGMGLWARTEGSDTHPF